MPIEVFWVECLSSNSQYIIMNTLFEGRVFREDEPKSNRTDIHVKETDMHTSRERAIYTHL